MKGWVLVDRRGKKPVLMQGTYGPTQLDAWDAAFYDIWGELGCEWGNDHWKREKAGIRSAKEHGFHIERVEVVLVKKGKKK